MYRAPAFHKLAQESDPDDSGDYYLQGPPKSAQMFKAQYLELPHPKADFNVSFCEKVFCR